MAAEAQIKAVITADDRASGTLNKFGDGLGSIGKLGIAAGVAIAAAGAATVAFGVSSVQAYSESEDALAQLGAVIKSTGGKAGVTAEQATNLATSLQKTTKYSDEAIISAENMLLTFTNIGKDVFPDTTKAVLDMSTAMGTDLKATSIQVGKALQDPINGVTSLQRVGVRLTDSQKKLVEQMVKAGDTAGAQRVILKELQTEFGGSAEAAGGTFAGALARLGNTFNDLQEQIGASLAEGLDPFIGSITDFISTHGPQIQATIMSVMDAFQQMFRIIYDIGVKAWPTLVTVFNFLKDVGVTTVNALTQAWNFLQPSVQALWNTIENNLWPSFQKLWTAIQPLLPVLGVVLVGALYVVINALNMVAKALTVIIDISTAWYNFFFQTLVPGIMAAFNWIAEKVTWLKDHFWEAVGFIIGFFLTLPIKIPMLVAQAIYATIAFLANINWNAVFASIGYAAVGVWDWVKRAAIDAFNYMKHINWGDLLVSVGKGIGNGIVGMLEGAINGALSNIPGSPKVRLPRFASGVRNFSGGMAIVGEQGPELVNLPRGSSVIPNSQIGQHSTTEINISLSGIFTGTPGDARKLAEMVADNLKTIAGSHNTTVTQMLGG